jgi:hypothetical protein
MALMSGWIAADTLHKDAGGAPAGAPDQAPAREAFA